MSPFSKTNANPIMTMIGFSLLFVVLYIEPLQLGPVKWSHAWKASLLILCVIVLAGGLAIRRSWPILETRKNRGLIIAWVLYALIPLMTIPTSQEILSPIFESTQRFLPLMVVMAFLGRFKGPAQTDRVLGRVSIFIAASFLPFILGLLPELGKVYDLSGAFGEDVTGTSGVFQKPHSAGLAAMIALLIAIYKVQLVGEKAKRWIWLAVASLAAIAILLTFVRAAVLGALIGVVVMSVVTRKLSGAIAAMLLMGLAGALLVSQFVDIDGITNRLLGKTVHSTSSVVAANELSSGRIGLWSAAASEYANGGISVWLTGIGRDQIPDAMVRSGLPPVFAHSAIFNELLGGGLVAVVSMLIMLISVLRVIRDIHDNALRSVFSAMFAGTIVFGVVQSLDYPLHLLVILLCLLANNRAQMRDRNAGLRYPWELKLSG